MKKNESKRIVKEDISAATKWTKGGQASAIEQIVSKYPTAAQFKNAILANGDTRSKALVSSLDPNMTREQYIDFLQHVFVKYSTTGKTLASALTGLGLGALTSYLMAKPAQKFGIAQGVKDEYGVDFRPIVGDKIDTVKGVLGAMGKFAASEGGRDTLANLKNVANDIPKFSAAIKDIFHIDLPADDLLKLSSAVKNFDTSNISASLDNFKGLATKIGTNALSGIANSAGKAHDYLKSAAAVEKIPNHIYDKNGNYIKTVDTDQYRFVDPTVSFLARTFDRGRRIYNKGQDYKMYGQIGGAVAGGLGGAGIANAIQSWREKQNQERINALKYQSAKRNPFQ